VHLVRHVAQIAGAKPIAMILSMGSVMLLINSVVDTVSGVRVCAAGGIAYCTPLSRVDAGFLGGVAERSDTPRTSSCDAAASTASQGA